MSSRRAPDPSRGPPRDPARGGPQRTGREPDHFPEDRRPPSSRTTDGMGRYAEEESRRSDRTPPRGQNRNYVDDGDEMEYENQTNDRRGGPAPRAPAREERSRSELYLEHTTLKENHYLLRTRGLSRDVMHSELGRFLGNNATSRAKEEGGGIIQFQYRGYRMLTDTMIEDLIHTTTRREADRQPRLMAPQDERRPRGYDDPQQPYRGGQSWVGGDGDEGGWETTRTQPSARPRAPDGREFADEQRRQYEEPRQVGPSLFPTPGYPSPNHAGFPVPSTTSQYQPAPGTGDYRAAQPRTAHQQGPPPHQGRGGPPVTSPGMYPPTGMAPPSGGYLDAQGHYVAPDGRVYDYSRR